MVTKKDFKAVAEIIRKQYEDGGVWCLDFAQKIANYFATQNPRFDCNRFMKACGL